MSEQRDLTRRTVSLGDTPHRTQVAVWDTPSAIEYGERFRVTLGVKCPFACRPDGWAIEIRDHDGKTRATATLSDTPWQGTDGLYYAVVDLKAPDTEGLFTWEARAPMGSPEVPHAEGIARFGVRVVPAPEHVLTVVAWDAERKTPVEGVKVVVHPYQAFTDERGVAEVKVPTGEYRLYVSGKNYAPFRRDGEVKADLTIKAELALDQGLSDVDIWS